jgi:hypothetical protein
VVRVTPKFGYEFNGRIEDDGGAGILYDEDGNAKAVAGRPIDSAS